MNEQSSPLGVIQYVHACAGIDVMPVTSFSAPSRMLGAFSAEIRKARSFPSIPRTLLFGMLLMLGAALFGMVQMGQFIAQGREDALMGLNMTDWPILLLHYGQVIPILLGAWVVGQDTPTGPRRSSFLATAKRGTLYGVKLVTAGLVALIAGIFCTIAALLPLLFSGGTDSQTTLSLTPYAWLLGYWVLIGVVTAALVAATRSITFAVIPILVWTIGLSDLLAAQIPALSGALDQAFKFAYLQGGTAPSVTVLIVAGVQVVAVIVFGAVLCIRRDAN